MAFEKKTLFLITNFQHSAFVHDSSMASIVAPGSLLSASATAAAGLGAYTLDGRVFASRCGKVEVATVTDDGGGPTTTTRYSVVSSPRRRIGGSASSRVPAVGDVVIGRVERVNPRFAKLVIVCVGNAVLSNQFQGLIQVLDIRAYEKVQTHFLYNHITEYFTNILYYLMMIIFYIRTRSRSTTASGRTTSSVPRSFPSATRAPTF